MEPASAAEATRVLRMRDVLLCPWVKSQRLEQEEGSYRPAFALVAVGGGCAIDQEAPAVGGAIDQRT